MVKWEACSKLNNKGQFSVIAALLVATVLVTTVVITYSSIRNTTLPKQPPIQSAVDETNLAIKQLLGFTLGYYGSVLKGTGNSTYARELAGDYLQSGLIYTANMHPQWGTSFDVNDTQLSTSWYSNLSYSSGSLSVNYNLTGLGITGITYNAFCSLVVQVAPTINNQALLVISKDGNEPLINLGKSNFNFYCYESAGSKWSLVNPPNEPLAYSNGTYQIDIPPGIDVNSYMVQVEDQRGILVIASSFSFYTINFGWNATILPTFHYVDNNTSDVDFSPNKGTHSNFTAMQYGPDGLVDTLSEAITTPGVPEAWVRPISYEGSWTDPSYAYDNNTSTGASRSVSARSWSSYLTLVSSAVSCHRIRYYIGRSQSQVDGVQIDVYNGTWINVYDGGGTWNEWTNVSFAEMSVSKMRFRFYNSHPSQSRTAYVYEAQFLQSGMLQNCELDVEAQWTDVGANVTDPWLCIYGGAMGTEDIRVDVRDGSTWKTLFTDLVGGWNNISVSQYIDSSTLTIRFKGGAETSDFVQDSWQIDAALLRSAGVGGNGAGDNIVVELLQNGTMRWLGENLQLTAQAKPFPPVPVRSIHVNQTANNVTSEVPFQVEDWGSEYRIPLGLTNNATVFNSRTMLVFLASANVSKVTIWWNGSDAATQTPYAYTNRYFAGDDISNGILTNGILQLKIERIWEAAYQATVFKVTSTQGSSTATARFMRINGKNSTFGAGSAYVIHHGIVRDIVQQEAEWSDGAPDCPNVYAHIVLTLPANVTYYTYQLGLMFVASQQNRTITDLSPLKLTVATGNPQTENGTLNGQPIVSSSTGLFYNEPNASAHHWSQFISGTKGAGIMFTEEANQELYCFDSIAGNATGAISVSNSTEKVIQLKPVAILPATFNYAFDAAWHGAIVTFDGTMPIYEEDGGVKTGLWIIVESPPTVTVITET